MEPSLFLLWVQKYFPGITLRVTQRYNDATQGPTYLYRRFLKKDFSVDGKWESLSVNNSLVAADIIAMDSSIPLKTRQSMGKASGDIPKVGMELTLNEKQLTDIQTMIARGIPDANIVAKIFADVPMVIGGQYERLEAMFLEGLSSGITQIDDSETVGTAIRVNYGYLPANTFGSSTPWANNGATPLTDMKPLLDKAKLDGNTITTVLTDRATVNGIAKSTEAKELYATFSGFFGTNPPTPTLSKLNEAVKDQYGFVFEVVDRSVRIQRNGVNTAVTPWKTGSVVFLTSDQVGSYVYARLAEQDYPVAGVNYQTVDDFILVSKFRENRPSLKEFTNSQSRIVPVIDNTDAIYMLDATQTNG